MLAKESNGKNAWYKITFILLVLLCVIYVVSLFNTSPGKSDGIDRAIVDLSYLDYYYLVWYPQK